MLHLRVRAPALEGRANAAALDLLAHALGLPKRAVRLQRGERSREKLVTIDAPALEPAEVWRRLGRDDLQSP